MTPQKDTIDERAHDVCPHAENLRDNLSALTRIVQDLSDKVTDLADTVGDLHDMVSSRLDNGYDKCYTPDESEE